LILTAKAPGFNEQQLQRTTRSLVDLRIWLDGRPQIHGRHVRALWRITQGLEQAVGVENSLLDTTGDDLAKILARVDAVITTPSTAMLEGMLQGVPVALLDYHNCPHLVPAAWTISSASHLDQVVSELVNPPASKMLYQQHLLHDALECDSPALPRLTQLIQRMHKLAKQCVAAGKPLFFPPNLLQRADFDRAVKAADMNYASLFPMNPAFGENDLARLQSEVGDLRASLAALTGLAADNARLTVQVQAAQSDLRALQAHHARVVEWHRQQLEAAYQQAQSAGLTAAPSTELRAA
jgi:hypothetical protein